MHRWRRWPVKQVGFFLVIYTVNFDSLTTQHLPLNTFSPFSSVFPLPTTDFCKERVSEANQRQAKLLRDWSWCSPSQRLPVQRSSAHRSTRTTDLIEIIEIISIRKKRFPCDRLSHRWMLEIRSRSFGSPRCPHCSKRCLVFRFRADRRVASSVLDQTPFLFFSPL